jgi:Xaa-Pro aminopeptidase
MISDSRYETQLADECPHLDIEVRDTKTTTLGGGQGRWATWDSRTGDRSQFHHLGRIRFLRTELKSAELAPLPPVVELLRAIKDATEIAKIELSISVNERAFQVIRAQLHGAQTEREIAHNLEHQMRAFGASKCAFPPIVGVGPRAALPHGQVTQQRSIQSICFDRLGRDGRWLLQRFDSHGGYRKPTANCNEFMKW